MLLCPEIVISATLLSGSHPKRDDTDIVSSNYINQRQNQPGNLDECHILRASLTSPFRRESEFIRVLIDSVRVSEVVAVLPEVFRALLLVPFVHARILRKTPKAGCDPRLP